MKKIVTYLKKSIYHLLAFLIPTIIIFSVLLIENIYWGSSTTILASDGFHQYVIFAQNLRNILHGSDSIFYTFTSGLGLNFYALLSYYLGSFLSPFVYFFNLTTMPDALYFFTLMKIGLIGLSSFTSLKKLHPKVLSFLLLTLSSSYALMSFAISQIEINMWLDVFILIPPIILGLNRLMTHRKILLYYLALSILFIQNYYFGYMTAIFLVFYFLVQWQQKNSWKIRWRQLVDFILVSVAAGLTSSIMLLPTYLDLSTHGEQYTAFTKLFTDNSWYLDLFAKQFVGAYDTTKFNAIPMIYVGLFPLVLAIIFFTLQTIRWQIRLAYALCFLIIIASFYIEPLDLIWQGMHSPNMFLHRYAWIFSVLVIFLAAETLSYIDQISIKQCLIAIVPLFIGFLTTSIVTAHYDFITLNHIIITFAFLVAYALLLISYRRHYLTKILFISFTVIFTLFESFLNTHYQIESLNNEWVFPSRSGYTTDLTDIDSLVKESKQNTDTFYRTERLLPQTGNDSMKFNYNGISQFSSIRNTLSSSVLDRLGFKSVGTNLNLRYQNNTLIADSLFAVKYNLTNSLLSKYGFNEVGMSGNTYLYENKNASQLAFLTDGIYKDVAFSVNTLDNQTSFLNNISGQSYQYFHRLSAQLAEGGSLLNNRVTSTSSTNGTTSITYQVTVPTNTQLYISIPNITFTNDNKKSVSISVKGRTITYTTDNAYSFFDVGYFDREETVEITIAFPENSQVSFDSPNFYSLDLTNYQKAMDIVNSKDITVKTVQNKVIADYTTEDKGSVVFTLPYDKGWRASLNGKSCKISKAQNGFMKVDVPSGTGQLVLTFIPNGIVEGTYLSLVGIVVILSYSYYLKKKSF